MRCTVCGEELISQGRRGHVCAHEHCSQCGAPRYEPHLAACPVAEEQREMRESMERELEQVRDYVRQQARDALAQQQRDLESSNTRPATLWTIGESSYAAPSEHVNFGVGSTAGNASVSAPLSIADLQRARDSLRATPERETIVPRIPMKPLDLKVERLFGHIGLGRETRTYFMQKALLDKINYYSERMAVVGGESVVYMAGAKGGVISVASPMKRNGGCRYMPAFDQETIEKAMLSMARRGFDCVGYIRILNDVKHTTRNNLGNVVNEMTSYPGFFLLTSGVDGIEVVTNEGYDRSGRRRQVRHIIVVVDGTRVFRLPTQGRNESLREQAERIMELKGGTRNESYISAVSKAQAGCGALAQDIS